MGSFPKMETQNKLKLLFNKLMEPNYNLDNYYSDSLLNKLQNPDQETDILGRSQLLAELVLNAFAHSSHTSVSVQTFIVRALAFVSKNELQYSKIINRHQDTILNAFRSILQMNIPPGLKVAYIELATNIASHNSGATWLMKTEIWKLIIQLCYEQQTVFVLRQVYKFVSVFLWKLSALDDEIPLKTVLEVILVPVVNNPYESVKSVSKDEEINLTKQVEQTINILWVTLNNNEIYESPLLVKLLVIDNNLIRHLLAIFCMTQREELLQSLSKMCFLIGFAKVFIDKPMMSKAQYTEKDFIDLAVSYYNTLQYFIKRGLFVAVLNYCNACHAIWAQAWSSKKGPIIRRYGKEINFQNQLVIIPLMPLLGYVKRKNSKHVNCRERLNDYIMNLFNKSCEHTVRAAYALRELIFAGDPLTMALQSVKRLSCLKSHLDNEQASLVFSALFYVLIDYEPFDDCGHLRIEEDSEDSTEKMLIMTYVMETILMLLKNFDISWNESIEVVCLYTAVSNILQRRNLSCKLIVAALNVITLTVKKFLPPNLSLLLESKPGAPINNIGQLIYSKMHDVNWEIKDSALEMLLVCTEISFIKYTPFQKQIIETNLIAVTATICLNESEFYVQASALKCLGAATKIQSIWDHLLQFHPNIQDNIISILANNSEGIVRKEAANVLHEIYQNLKLTPAFKTRLYEHMVSAAIADFHWEVQVTALKFWKTVIHNLFTNQGMLDGNFPPVTFSKQSRKIVTLDQTEINKILINILDELAVNGCLTVLVKLLQDSDAEIVDNAYQVSNELYAILLKYNVCDIILSSEASSPVLTNEYTNIKQDIIDYTDPDEQMHDETAPKSDKVIDAIVNSNDINLLSNIYQQSMRLQTEQGNEINVNPKIKLERYMSPLSFIKIMNDKDFKSIINEKRHWNDGIRSLSSLLDDILGLYDCTNEVNSLDCY